MSPRVDAVIFWALLGSGWTALGTLYRLPHQLASRHKQVQTPASSSTSADYSCHSGVAAELEFNLKSIAIVFPHSGSRNANNNFGTDFGRADEYFSAVSFDNSFGDRHAKPCPDVADRVQFETTSRRAMRGRVLRYGYGYWSCHGNE